MELELRLANNARSKALDKNTASFMEGPEDEMVQGAEKPDRMKQVRKPSQTKEKLPVMNRPEHFIGCWALSGV